MQSNVLLDWLRAPVGVPSNPFFIIEPILAALLGLWTGRLDGLAGRVPYVWGLLFERGRKARVRAALDAASVPLVVGVVLDALLQLLIWGTMNPRRAVLFGVVLVALPYSIARALGNRRVRAARRSRRSTLS